MTRARATTMRVFTVTYSRVEERGRVYVGPAFRWAAAARSSEVEEMGGGRSEHSGGNEQYVTVEWRKARAWAGARALSSTFCKSGSGQFPPP